MSLRRKIARGVAWVIRAKFTAGSLVYVENADGLVLLVRPRSDPRAWSLPGGFHKGGEEPLDTAIREVREETGITLTENDLTSRDQYRQSHASHYDHLFSAVVDSTPQTLGPSSFMAKLEIAEVGWFDLRSAQSSPPLNRAAREALEKLNRVPGFQADQSN